MKSPADLKKAALAAVDAARDDLYAIGDTIMRQPELGFKEFKTAALVSAKLHDLGIDHRSGLAVTGLKAVLDTGRPGPTIAVLGELDSVIVGNHPLADPDTHAAHACGHNAQLASLLGVATVLAKTDIMESLSGRAVLMAVPAEEYVEMAYRLGLKREGKIEFLGGKPELIRLGEFDDVDMAMMCHTATHAAPTRFTLPVSMNGFVAKLAEFIGKAAHAGGAPDKGINALNAAMLAMSAIHAQRETFRDPDTVRIHPIINKGGELVNVVPADVVMEMAVRARTLEAIFDAEKKVNRSLRAGAMAVGAKLCLTTAFGYMPYQSDPTLVTTMRENVVSLFGSEGWKDVGHLTPSTDMGDISQIMPAIQPEAAGSGGAHHAADWTIADRDAAYLNPARLMAMTVIDLLSNEAALAKRVLAETPPKLPKAEYLAMLRRMDTFVEYEEA
ncbi:MAG: amidohydrolase [Chloroflexota bacterium]